MISVLVVDNDAAYAAAAGRFLASQGMRTILEVSSLAALQRFQDDEAHVLVADIRLHPAEPQGFALARMVRHQRPDFPIILVTTSASCVQGESGPDGRVLLKPFDLSELGEEIRLAVHSRTRITDRPELRHRYRTP